MYSSSDVNDPPTNIQVPNLNMKENSVENILISPVIVLDQDGNVRGCRLLDDAGGRVKLIGMNLVAGPNMTNFEAVPRPKTLTIKLNCSDVDNKSLARSFAINVKGNTAYCKCLSIAFIWGISVRVRGRGI